MYSSNGISFLSSTVLAEELGAMRALGRVVTFQRSKISAANIYANGINYKWYGDSPEFDINNPTSFTDFDPWSLGKLASEHSEVYGSDSTFGNNVFGFPLMAVNTSGVASSVSLQMAHNEVYQIEYVSHTATEIQVRVLSGYQNRIIGKQLMFAYYDSSLVNNAIPGFDSPNTNLAVSARLSEKLGTILSADTTNLLPIITVNKDEGFNDTEIVNLAYMAPDTQTLMILPLGTGYVDDPLSPEIMELTSDTYPNTPDSEGIPSWIYNQDAAAMSEQAVCATSVVDLVLEPNQVVKLIGIGWRKDPLVTTNHGLVLGLL